MAICLPKSLNIPNQILNDLMVFVITAMKLFYFATALTLPYHTLLKVVEFTLFKGHLPN